MGQKEPNSALPIPTGGATRTRALLVVGRHRRLPSVRAKSNVLSETRAVDCPHVPGPIDGLSSEIKGLGVAMSSDAPNCPLMPFSLSPKFCARTRPRGLTRPQESLVLGTLLRTIGSNRLGSGRIGDSYAAISWPEVAWGHCSQASSGTQHDDKNPHASEPRTLLVRGC